MPSLRTHGHNHHVSLGPRDHRNGMQAYGKDVKSDNLSCLGLGHLTYAKFLDHDKRLKAEQWYLVVDRVHIIKVDGHFQEGIARAMKRVYRQYSRESSLTTSRSLVPSSRARELMSSHWYARRLCSVSLGGLPWVIMHYSGGRP